MRRSRSLDNKRTSAAGARGATPVRGKDNLAEAMMRRARKVDWPRNSAWTQSPSVDTFNEMRSEMGPAARYYSRRDHAVHDIKLLAQRPQVNIEGAELTLWPRGQPVLVVRFHTCHWLSLTYKNYIRPGRV